MLEGEQSELKSGNLNTFLAYSRAVYFDSTYDRVRGCPTYFTVCLQRYSAATGVGGIVGCGVVRGALVRCVFCVSGWIREFFWLLFDSGIMPHIITLQSLSFILCSVYVMYNDYL